MKSILILISFIIASYAISAQQLYTQTYGNPTDRPLLFLHGGPGYNSVNFEQTTAKKLAESGFFVIVYDRRGEGRSKDKNAQFTFQQTFDDIESILNENQISKITLLGHSFGGAVATLFAEKYPEKVNQIILIGAPVSLQETFKTIIKSSKVLYESKNDSTNLKYIEILENMDQSSLAYSSYCFGHAMQNGFYSPKKLTEEAKSIYNDLKADALVKQYTSQMTFEAPLGFWTNEQYTSIDLTNPIRNVLNHEIPVFGIYGKEDGLYSVQQIEDLKTLIGAENVKYLDDCSHNVFIDQQIPFIEAVQIWVK